MKKYLIKIPPELAHFIHLGWSVTAILTASCLLGIYLDRKFDSSPIALLINFFIGLAIAGYLFYSAIKKSSKSRENKNYPT